MRTYPSAWYRLGMADEKLDIAQTLITVLRVQREMLDRLEALDCRLLVLEKYVSQDSISKESSLNALYDIRSLSQRDLLQLEAFDRRCNNIEQRMVLHDADFAPPNGETN